MQRRAHGHPGKSPDDRNILVAATGIQKPGYSETIFFALESYPVQNSGKLFVVLSFSNDGGTAFIYLNIRWWEKRNALSAAVFN